MERHIKKILAHTPKIQDVPHVFWSSEADVNTGGSTTASLVDEFGENVSANFIGGVSIDHRGNIIPNPDEEALDAPSDSYNFIGYMDEETGRVIRSDYTPEVPQYYVETDDRPTEPESDFSL
ncbi:MAG: hypothetical protein ACRBCK_09425 [Alphaproteobacteria bacterium]